MLGAAGLAGLIAAPGGVLPIAHVGALTFVAAGLVAFATLARREPAASDAASRPATIALVALPAD